MSEDTCARCDGTGKNRGGRRCGRCGGEGRAPSKVERLRAENEQLREALEPFVYKDGCDCGIPSCARGEKKCRWCKAAALMNVALGGSQAKGSE